MFQDPRCVTVAISHDINRMAGSTGYGFGEALRPLSRAVPETEATALDLA